MAILGLSQPLMDEKPINRRQLHTLERLLDGDDRILVTLQPEAKNEEFSVTIKAPDAEVQADEDVQLTSRELRQLLERIAAALDVHDAVELVRFKDFTIYSPERSALLRRRDDSSTPVGILGEGTLEVVHFLANHRTGVFEQLSGYLHTMDWFESIEFNGRGPSSESEVFLRDKFVSAKFSSQAANEGFLLLLFYFAMILSNETPRIFAIENVDQTLNPRLCRRLAEELSNALRQSGKQAFVTVHNPMFLDGLDFRQDDVGLFIVKRDFDGHTIVRLVSNPERFSTGKRRLSQAFIDGQIGGLPENF
jgi:predicted ATPase